MFDTGEEFESQVNLEFGSSKQMGLWFCISDHLKNLIEHQERQTMLLDVDI